MKKIIAIVLVLAMVFSFTACGSASETPVETIAPIVTVAPATTAPTEAPVATETPVATVAPTSSITYILKDRVESDNDDSSSDSEPTAVTWADITSGDFSWSDSAYYVSDTETSSVDDIENLTYSGTIEFADFAISSDTTINMPKATLVFNNVDESTNTLTLTSGPNTNIFKGTVKSPVKILGGNVEVEGSVSAIEIATTEEISVSAYDNGRVEELTVADETTANISITTQDSGYVKATNNASSTISATVEDTSQVDLDNTAGGTASVTIPEGSQGGASTEGVVTLESENEDEDKVLLVGTAPTSQVAYYGVVFDATSTTYATIAEALAVSAAEAIVLTADITETADITLASGQTLAILNNASLTIDNGLKLTVVDGSSLTINEYGELANGGTVIIDGELDNNGEFYNYDSTGGDLYVGGTFTNNGLFDCDADYIEISANGTFTNNGSFWFWENALVNDGTVENNAEMIFYYNTFANNGSFVNNEELCIDGQTANYTGNQIVGDGYLTAGYLYGTYMISTYLSNDYSSITDQTMKIIDSVTVNSLSLTIDEGKVVTVEEGVVVTLSKTDTITVHGELNIYGSVVTSDGSSANIARWATTQDEVLTALAGDSYTSVIIGADLVIDTDMEIPAEKTVSLGEYTVDIDGTLTGKIYTLAVEGSTIINSDDMLAFALVSIDGESIKLGSSIEFDTDEIGVISIYTTIVLDLCENTITVPNDVSTTDRPFLIRTGGDFTMKNGTFIAGTNQNEGAYGAIYGRDYSYSNISIDGMYFVNSYQNVPSVKVTDSYLTISNSIFESQYGGALYTSYDGQIDVYDCIVTQSGYYNYNSTALSAGYGAILNVTGGTYSGVYCAYIFSSGAIINLYSGDYIGSTAVLKSDYATGKINVYGGTFDGAIVGPSDNSTDSFTFMGGTFKNTGLTLDEFKVYVPSGYTATEIESGVYTVTAD